MKNKCSKMRRQLGLVYLSLSMLFICSQFGCSASQTKNAEVVFAELTVTPTEIEKKQIELGNENIKEYLPLLKGKKVAFVGNHTSVINKVHLVDTLLKLKVNLVKVFSPEHGFRGTADAGEKVKSNIDEQTKLPVISLYGNNKKPTNQQLEGVEVVLFDIQDVGVRFYTYISTLHYVMEAAAENGIQVIVLDKPNPNGHYIDGPILEKKYKSFIGLHPVPVIHGMTIGEYAQMINGEKWLKNEVNCKLKVIPCKNYAHNLPYEIKIPPSPNLPNMKSIYLYPSVCFFEGTPISVGRGTEKPFQQIGNPKLKNYEFSFIPKPTVGAKNPKLKGKSCKGLDLSLVSAADIREKAFLDLSYLITFYEQYPDKEKYFTNFFNLLAGNSSLQKAILEGKSEIEIKENWKDGLEEYQLMREKYLIYD